MSSTDGWRIVTNADDRVDREGWTVMGKVIVRRVATEKRKFDLDKSSHRSGYLQRNNLYKL